MAQLEKAASQSQMIEEISDTEDEDRPTKGPARPRWAAIRTDASTECSETEVESDDVKPISQSSPIGVYGIALITLLYQSRCQRSTRGKERQQLTIPTQSSFQAMTMISPFEASESSGEGSSRQAAVSVAMLPERSRSIQTPTAT